MLFSSILTNFGNFFVERALHFSLAALVFFLFGLMVAWWYYRSYFTELKNARNHHDRLALMLSGLREKSDHIGNDAVLALEKKQQEIEAKGVLLGQAQGAEKALREELQENERVFDGLMEEKARLLSQVESFKGTEEELKLSRSSLAELPKMKKELESRDLTLIAEKKRSSEQAGNIERLQVELKGLTARLEGANRDLNECRAQVKAGGEKQKQELAGARRALDEKEKAVTEKDRALAELKKELKKKDGTLAKQKNVLAEQKKALAENEGTLTEQKKALAEKEGALTAVQEQVAELEKAAVRARDGSNGGRAKEKDVSGAEKVSQEVLERLKKENH
ncbi:MAG: hypothetical protein AAF514_02770, partial [Verrucomicrobiota bacterium]